LPFASHREALLKVRIGNLPFDKLRGGFRDGRIAAPQNEEKRCPIECLV
jgi:hypothetical protein